MCVTFLYLNDKGIDDTKSYQLILLNNRDEGFDRPTSTAAWEDGVLCGKDRANPYHGTWLGMTRNGRLGALHSVLENRADELPNAVSRGKLIHEYLRSELPPERYVTEQLSKEAQQYNGFNIILLDRLMNEAIGQKTYSGVHFTNRYGSTSEKFGPGVYGFGNNAVGKPFKKVTYGLRLFEEKLKMLDDENVNEQQLMKEFLAILTDQTCHHPDEQLIAQRKQDNERSKLMSRLFYELPKPLRYGTRSHTIVLVNGVGRCTFFERSRKQSTPESDVTWIDTTHYFDLDDL